MTKQKFLGLSGKAGHGKDAVASLLCQLFGEYGVQRRALADALKEDMFEELVVTKHCAPTRYGAWYKQWALQSGDGSAVTFINSIKHHPEVRALLQTYGVAQRKAQSDYWIQRLMQWAQARPEIKVVVVPDVRFINEADAIREAGGMVFRVLRPGYNNGLSAEAQAHISETELDAYPHFTGKIYNDGSLEDLRRQLQGSALEYFIRKGAGHVGVGGNHGT